MSHTNEMTLDRMIPPSEAKIAIGCGTTFLYELIAAGKLDARKMGRHTRISARSIAAYQTSLPKAELTTGRKTAA